MAENSENSSVVEKVADGAHAVIVKALHVEYAGVNVGKLTDIGIGLGVLGWIVKFALDSVGLNVPKLW